MTVILLTADLTVVSRVEGAAARTGMATHVVSSETAAIERGSGDQAKLVIVDLNAPLRDLKSLVEHFKALSPSTRIVAFGPHVHEEKLAGARDAGCDEVVSRGQFFSQMDVILQR